MISTMASDLDGPMPRVGVITPVQRRRRWSTAEKVRLVDETMQPRIPSGAIVYQFNPRSVLLGSSNATLYSKGIPVFGRCNMICPEFSCKMNDAARMVCPFVLIFP